MLGYMIALGYTPEKTPIKRPERDSKQSLTFSSCEAAHSSCMQSEAHTYPLSQWLRLTSFVQIYHQTGEIKYLSS